jgi:predicted AlkP superfamily pyrophosphatase or phosphodiesterase
MKRVYLPNYKNGSIVNLMSSIAESFGGKTIYNPLKILPPEKLDSKNIILLVIDGMGFHYLNNKGKNTILNDFVLGPITSVFLPTTAAAITSFLTGVAPQQHAFTGWYMNLKEVGVVSKILPFSPRVGGDSFSEYGIDINKILNCEGFFSKIKVKSFVISPKRIADSDFTKAVSKKAERKGYKNLNDMFRQIKRAINSSNRRKYVYAYWSELDSLNHEHGVESKKAEKHYNELDKKLRDFIRVIKKTDTTLIITADHGFVNTPQNRIIDIEDHPKLKECLTLPLCGEGRTVYCYVHPSKARDFEKYVRTKLKKYCWIYKSEDLIKKNYFGLFNPSSKLFDRVGDYILVCKENYIIKDFIKEDKKHPHIGHHGGVSKEEMFVPLIVIR